VLGLGGLVAVASLLADHLDTLLTGNNADGLLVDETSILQPMY
jgi:hypothetical protein